MTKIWAIHGGGDWADASAEYLILPPGLDIDAEDKAWHEWYHKEYCPQLRADMKPKFRTLVEWLKDKGAREPSTDELEIHSDY